VAVPLNPPLHSQLAGTDATVHSSGSAGVEPGDAVDAQSAIAWPDALRIAAVAIAAAMVWFRLWEPVPRFSVPGLLGVMAGGWPILKEAAKNTAKRRMTMELSMSIAVVAAAAIGEFFTALIITLFVLIAEVLERMTVARGRKAIREWLDFLPRLVSVRRAGSIHALDAEELRIGDAVWVNPGGRVPVDGTVIGGHSFVDQSRITGEFMPVEKSPGAGVYAGSINQSGALEVRAERIGRDTSYGRIIEAVENAEHLRAPVQRIADRLAAYLVYFALGASALTFLVTHDMRSTISVVIVAGACGVAAGTPLAILGGIGRSAKRGSVVKGGVYLETLGRVNTIVLDKTGTLTFGRPQVERIVPITGETIGALLTAAASAELRSEHPLGKSIVADAQQRGLIPTEPERFDYMPGRGIVATVGGTLVQIGNRLHMSDCRVAIPSNFLSGIETRSEIFVARDGRFLGSISVTDTVRPGARRAVETLSRMGMRTLLLTGDSKEVADALAERLGIRECEAGLLPEDKLTRIKQLIEGGSIVAMVGDGINDAAALSAANVGVAMGSGTDVARESADVVLLGNDLERFVETVVIARRTRRIIWQNFAGTILVDLAGIAMAAAGILNPLFAAFVHVSSEMAFILNSARLLPGIDRRTIPSTSVASGPS